MNHDTDRPFEVDWRRCSDQHASDLTLWVRLRIGRYLQSKADAEDLVQEAFFQAVAKREQFRGRTEAEFRAWLRAILESRIEKFLRRYRPESGRDPRAEIAGGPVGSEGGGLIDGLPGSDTSPSAGAHQNELTAVVAAALARLPEAAREVLVLRHFEGLTFPQIAGRLDRSPEAVTKLWQRSLPALRKFLGDPR
jgi:RNA polymerase sigma-70 factor (ECF subfamily)